MKLDGVTATKIKTFRGMEGSGYNAVLTIDGKPVASIFNEGCGGPTYLRDVIDRAAVEAFEARVKALPPEPLDMGDGETRMIAVTSDYFLGMLVEDVLEEKRLARLAKTNVVLRLPSDPPGQYRTIKGLALDEKGRAWIAQKHPGAEVVNDRLGVVPQAPARKAKVPARRAAK